MLAAIGSLSGPWSPPRTWSPVSRVIAAVHVATGHSASRPRKVGALKLAAIGRCRVAVATVHVDSAIGRSIAGRG